MCYVHLKRTQVEGKCIYDKGIVSRTDGREDNKKKRCHEHDKMRLNHNKY
jgi:hypothetical protein